jgi:hypothetical protein
MVKRHSAHDQQNESSSQEFEYAYINKEKFLTFYTADHATVEQQKLSADIVALDHRAHWRLRPETPEWKEVLGLLVNAANLGVTANCPVEGRVIFEEAQKAYYHHNQTKNRIKYLLGTIIGVAVASLLGSVVFILSKFLEPFITSQFLILYFVFAGIGSITSVLTRISSIDLSEEVSNFSIILSGAARPIVAMFLSLIVYLVLDMKIIDVKFGSPSEDKINGIYLVSSFLCGFSERFAGDIIARVPFVNPTEKT